MNIFKPLQPLLIPSFSSKGCDKYFNAENKLTSVNTDLLSYFNFNLSNTYLISAYDVYHGFMPSDPETWPHTDYLFLDSGGYETNTSDGSSESWNEKLMEQVYEKVYNSNNFSNSIIVFTTYDTFENLDLQIKAALDLKAKFPNSVIDFLIKLNAHNAPKSKTLAHDILQYADKIKNFRLIGLTEEEIGKSVKERVLNLIAIRKSLDYINWNGYLHIFGGLDPTLMKLYFYSGATIFDGLAWQRMSLEDSASLFSMNYANINDTEFENRLNLMKKNLSFLQSLSCKMSIIDFDEIVKIREKLQYVINSHNMSVHQLLKELEV